MRYFLPLNNVHLGIGLEITHGVHTGVHNIRFVVNALRELSVGLCRGNCVLYKRSLFALARVSGTAFRAGADIPTSDII